MFSSLVYAASIEEQTKTIMKFLQIDKPTPMFVISYDWSRLTKKQLDIIKKHQPYAQAFYSYGDNTIYLKEGSAESMIGHELTHAILCNCFCEILPEATQEILAGYVEYTLYIKNQE